MAEGRRRDTSEPFIEDAHRFPDTGEKKRRPSSPADQDARRRRAQQRKRRNSVFQYIAILFMAAFVLLLFTFMMERRQSRQQIDDLKQSASAVQSLNILMEENQSLKEQLEAKDRDIAAAEQKAQDNLQTAWDKEQIAVAMNQLNTRRALYNQSRYREARGLLSELGEEGQAQVRTLLEEAANLLSQEDRGIYDPLNAWDQLISWLN